jgi:hypothetical protein
MIKDDYLVELQQVDWDSLGLVGAKQMFEKLARQWDFKKKIDEDIEIANGMTNVTDIMTFAWNCCLVGLGMKVMSYGR